MRNDARCRISPDVGHIPEASGEGDHGASKRRSSSGFPHKGRSHSAAQSSREEQPGSSQDASGPRIVPNYKDMRGLTTLYYSVVYNSNPQLTEMLLHDHAFIGTSDPHGWQEVHQACKYGLVQHLEHLLFYGADMNARNASGNTPRTCAPSTTKRAAPGSSCSGVRIRTPLNYANQNPHQVAIIAGNLRLAEIIKNHKPEDVGEC
ncbi:SH3 and multiple ankyrin repeat domains protein 3 [Caerostris extrusa]|uniref:SH3 and multiple ankyrin repeat domains protein 3 n=1 Tax=Caerostris extrusa TaxID=172846 RepID=A0AAV4SF66_CAEEX|nr:SH3 and multiple ankyrin repeat domains protein 3 [Caerostris extrusa]